MRFEKKIYRSEAPMVDEKQELKRLKIQKYLITRFSINENMAVQISDILERTSLTYEKIVLGNYDGVIRTIISDFSNISSKIDAARAIRKMEKDEHVVKVSNNKESHDDNEEKGQLMDERIAEANEKKKAIDKQIEELMSVMNDNVDSVIHRRWILEFYWFYQNYESKNL